MDPTDDEEERVRRCVGLNHPGWRQQITARTWNPQTLSVMDPEGKPFSLLWHKWFEGSTLDREFHLLYLLLLAKRLHKEAWNQSFICEAFSSHPNEVDPISFLSHWNLRIAANSAVVMLWLQSVLQPNPSLGSHFAMSTCDPFSGQTHIWCHVVKCQCDKCSADLLSTTSLSVCPQQNKLQSCPF